VQVHIFTAAFSITAAQNTSFPPHS